MELDGMAIWKRGTYTLQDLIGRNVLGNNSFENLASNIPNARNKAEIYLKISKVLRNQEKKEESEEAIKESLNVAHQIKDEVQRSKVYKEISGC